MERPRSMQTGNEKRRKMGGSHISLSSSLLLRHYNIYGESEAEAG